MTTFWPMQYTTIFHSVRKQFGLSNNDYCLVDMIDTLSGPNAPVPGWCTATRGYLAAENELSRQSVISIIQAMIAKGLLEESDAKYLRPTQAWKWAVAGCKESLQGVKKLDTLSTIEGESDFNECQKTLHPVKELDTQTGEGVKKLDTECKETLQQGCKESLQQGVKKLDTIIRDYNKSLDNEIYNTTLSVENSVAADAAESSAETVDVSSVSTLEEKKPTPTPDSAPPPSPPKLPDGVGDGRLRNQCLAYNQQNIGKYKPDMYKAFLAYWTAPVQNGKKSEIGKELWETQKTWNLAGRLATWHHNELRDEQRNQQNGRKSAHFLNHQRAAEPAKNGYGQL